MPTPPHVDPDRVLHFPAIEVFLNDAQPRVTISGTEYVLEGHDLDSMRENARIRVARTAQSLGRPVRVTAHEPTGSWPLIIHPDGTVQDGPAPPTPTKGNASRLLPLLSAAAVAAIAGGVIALGTQAAVTNPPPTPAPVTLTPSPAPTVTRTKTATTRVTTRITTRITTRVTVRPPASPSPR
jgi:hypothetical protein